MFTREFMRGVLWSEHGEILRDRITEASRWSLHHELIFKYDGKFYETHYSEGSTEAQHEEPWEYNDPEVVEVVQVEKMTIDYVPIKK